MRFVEKGLWFGGALLIAVFFAGQWWGQSASSQDIAAFVERQQQADAESTPLPAANAASAQLAGYRVPPSAAFSPASIRDIAAPASAVGIIALLRIPRIELQVPVSYGTSHWILSRGAGLIEGTAPPGSAGNVAIAAHRDSFFRGLKDVVIGDLIELESHGRTDRYRISALSVVEPTDVHVLANTGEAALTLVTCYPFYFLGNAPQRFIVRAVATGIQPQPPGETHEDRNRNTHLDHPAQPRDRGLAGSAAATAGFSR